MMEQNVKICAVVVTFNRKELLKNCLNAIQKQTYKPHTVIIVDNASTDGTQSLVEESGYYNQLVDGIKFQYLLLPNNQGGAGGFYHGMKTAYDSPENFDAVWVMDDDGVPDRRQLEELTSHLSEYDYIAPLVLSIEDSSRLAFHYHGKISANELISKFESVVPDFACPFNGILYSRKLISRIGYPIPNLFIWGDEQNYALRAIEAGFRPYTILNAIHYHPSDRMEFTHTIFNKEIINVPNKWRGYCFWRNLIYNYKRKMSFKNYVSFFIYNASYLLFYKKSMSWFLCFVDAFASGFKQNPDDGFRKYM